VDPATRSRPTERELMILHCLVRRLTDSQIARDLGISERTVRYDIPNLFTRFQVGSRVEIVVEAIRREWVSVHGPGWE
jgi:DNA-binding NarL/FixJ family response regulator